MNRGAGVGTPGVRPYTPADHGACVELLRTNVPDFALPHEVAEYAEWLARATARGEVRYAVTERDGALLACGGLARAETAPVATLCWGLVRRDRHGEGLGTALLRERLRWAAEDDGVELVAMDTSPRTVGFFARFGFRVVATAPDGYGPGLDRLDLELRLDGSIRARLRGA
jgi:GNAT superfamily N-acetyltransferase